MQKKCMGFLPKDSMAISLINLILAQNQITLYDYVMFTEGKGYKTKINIFQ